MYTDGKVLDILFRRTSPDRIFNDLKARIQSDEDSFYIDSEKDNKAFFMDYAESSLSGYSKNEQEYLYNQLGQIKTTWDREHYAAEKFLVPVIRYAEKNLVIRGNVPLCKTESILDWRENYLRLGQDLFVCTFLAHFDHENKINRTDFAWPSIIHVDNNELNNTLKKGIADNHNHINGGTSSFQITWCRMMNFPEKIRDELEHFYKSVPLLEQLSRSKGDYTLSLEERLELAASIRSILFRAIHREIPGETFRNVTKIDGEKKNREQLNSSFSSKDAFCTEYIKAAIPVNEINKQVECLRSAYGVRLDLPDESDICFDYALEEDVIRNCVNSHVRVLVGERAFLYRCVKHCLENRFNDIEKQLFYLYLVLKSNFRSEMIQANNYTGFANFLEYQNRKDDAWDKNFYFWEAVRMGINHPMNDESVSSLEARLVPKAKASKNIEKIMRFDKAKRFADCQMDDGILPDQSEYDPEIDKAIFRDAPYFFVFHFIKKEDNRKLTPGNFNETPCRHQDLRKELKETARGLAQSLMESDYLRSRVRGIDASASELYTRPEVFAVAFRYMKLIEQRWNGRGNGFLPSSPIRLGITYHAGEDFLDIADGLRAIDETIEYLELLPGSRIGHALALGVKPEDHYHTKHFESVTTRQDRLDDLAWILYRSKELGIVIKPELKYKLQDEAYTLLREIYGKAIQKNNWQLSLRLYRLSMKLRADDPEYYRYQQSDQTQNTDSPVERMPVDEMAECLLKKSDAYINSLRGDKAIAGLYHYYQFGAEEGLKGKETYTFKVDQDYMDLMRELQNAMMAFVDQKYISIECNPSSNVLIGTFKEYEKHPIFRFNDRMLAQTGNRKKPVQLLVSINTDDLGIFDTSLEFEYALIYQALVEMRKSDPEKNYDNRTIIEYLNDLRRMGIRSVFPANK